MFRSMCAFFAVLSVVPSVLAVLDLRYPTAPEATVAFPIVWAGGLPPYTVYVLNPSLANYYFKYVGSALTTAWTVDVLAGTEVVFQVRDSSTPALEVTSPSVTVIPDLDLRYPSLVTQDVAATLTWSGGLAPYTIYVLNADLATYLYKYTGSALTTTFPMDIPGGTGIVFQAVDNNGVKATSPSVTVLSGGGGGGGGGGNSSLSLLSVESQSVLSTISVASLLSSGVTTTFASTATSAGAPCGKVCFSPSSGASSTTGGLTSTTGSTSARPTQSGGGALNGGAAKKSSTNVGAIAGGVVGGVLGLAIIGALVFFLTRRARNTATPVDPAPGDGPETAALAGAAGAASGAPYSASPFNENGPNGYYAGDVSGYNASGAASGYNASGAASGYNANGAPGGYNVGGGGYPYAQSVATAGAAGVGAGAGAGGNNLQGQREMSQYHPSTIGSGGNTHGGQPEQSSLSYLNEAYDPYAPGSPAPVSTQQQQYNGLPEV